MNGTSTACIEVLDGGLGNTVQDGGRVGHRRIGVPLSGAADRVLLACANRLVGNPDTAAAIETGPLGPRLAAVAGPVRLALAGALTARIESSDDSRTVLPPWQSATLHPGETLVVGAAAGVGYLALAGGLQVAERLGSRSTYARARLGGIDGRALAAGDRIACLAAGGTAERRAAAPFSHAGGAIRVIPGPQLEHFSDAALATLLGAEFSVTRERDRMGMRLDGPRLAHRPERGADIVSDGVVPGAIQVPADGRAIVLLADAQTVGGYAKIAVVISADLPRLAQLAPGTRLRFAAVSLAEAALARQLQRDALQRWTAGIVPWRPAGTIDTNLLHSANLISGIVDMRDDAGATPPEERA